MHKDRLINKVWDFIINVGRDPFTPFAVFGVHKYRRSASPVGSQLNAQTLDNYPAANIMCRNPTCGEHTYTPHTMISEELGL